MWGTLSHKSDPLLIVGVKTPSSSNHSLKSMEKNTKYMYNALIQDKVA